MIHTGSEQSVEDDENGWRIGFSMYIGSKLKDQFKDLGHRTQSNDNIEKLLYYSETLVNILYWSELILCSCFKQNLIVWMRHSAVDGCDWDLVRADTILVDTALIGPII